MASRGRCENCDDPLSILSLRFKWNGTRTLWGCPNCALVSTTTPYGLSTKRARRRRALWRETPDAESSQAGGLVWELFASENRAANRNRAPSAAVSRRSRSFSLRQGNWNWLRGAIVFPKRPAVHLVSPQPAGTTARQSVISDVLIVLSIPFVAGVLAAYAYRAHIFRRNRRRARGYAPR